MKYLLDTHTLIWLIGNSKKIPQKVRLEIENPANAIFVSAISFWEIAMKSQRGTFDLGGLKTIDLVDHISVMGISLISLEPSEAAGIENLSEPIHFDPFDRMLIWQAICRDLTLISGDNEFESFKRDGLKLLWK